jgi:hypothetical protein
MKRGQEPQRLLPLHYLLPLHRPLPLRRLDLAMTRPTAPSFPLSFAAMSRTRRAGRLTSTH